MALPDPIPNSEVKRCRADDSLAHASAKVGSCPYMEKLSFTGEFFCYLVSLAFMVCLYYNVKSSIKVKAPKPRG